MSRSSFRSLPVFWASLLALALAGCATPSQTSAEDPGATPEGGATKTGEGEMKADNANEAKPEGAATATAANEGAATPTPASTDAPAPAPAERAAPEASSALSVSAEPAANPETAKLIAQLNDASRELAILRATNARLTAERDRSRDRSSSRVSEPVVRTDPADEKLGASLKSFAALKQELSSFVTEMEQLRSDNASFNSRLKEAQARADDAQSSLARLERELRAEKRSRQEAQQAAASLQEQLRAVARAVSSAGLSSPLGWRGGA